MNGQWHSRPGVSRNRSRSMKSPGTARSTHPAVLTATNVRGTTEKTSAACGRCQTLSQLRRRSIPRIHHRAVEKGISRRRGGTAPPLQPRRQAAGRLGESHPPVRLGRWRAEVRARCPPLAVPPTAFSRDSQRLLTVDSTRLALIDIAAGGVKWATSLPAPVTQFTFAADDSTLVVATERQAFHSPRRGRFHRECGGSR